MSSFPSFSEAPPQLLNTQEYRHWSRSQKTKLGWPLFQVFVSKRSQLMYCPIGKVACTHLKKQMVRISNLPHQEFIISSIHDHTDTFVTGIQLSDYPEPEARSMMSDPGILRIAVLRKPAVRLLSAYMEKFVINRTSTGSAFHTMQLVSAVQAKQGLAEISLERGISFRAFVEGIASAPPKTLDPHWCPQSSYLVGMNYERLFTLEKLNDVIELMEERSGIALPRQRENMTGSEGGENVPGAANLLPAEILARPRINVDSFLEPDLMDVISTVFAEDLSLYRVASQ